MKPVENIVRFERHRQKAQELQGGDLKDYLVYTALAMECFQAVNALIEIGQYLVARHKLGFPSSYREVFELLQRSGRLSEEAFQAAARLVYLLLRLLWVPQRLRCGLEHAPPFTVGVPECLKMPHRKRWGTRMSDEAPSYGGQ